MAQLLVVEALASPRLPPGVSGQEALGAMLRGLCARGGVPRGAVQGVLLGGASPGLGRLSLAASRLPLTLPGYEVGGPGLAALNLAAPHALPDRAGVWLLAEASPAASLVEPGDEAQARAEWPVRRSATGEEEEGPERLDHRGVFVDSTEPGGLRIGGLALCGSEALRRHRLRVRARLAAIAVGAGDPIDPVEVLARAVEEALEAAGLGLHEVGDLCFADPCETEALRERLMLEPERVIRFGENGLSLLARQAHGLAVGGGRYALCAGGDGRGQAWAAVLDREWG